MEEVILMGDSNCSPYSEPIEELETSLQRITHQPVPYGKHLPIVASK